MGGSAYPPKMMTSFVNSPLLELILIDLRGRIFQMEAGYPVSWKVLRDTRVVFASICCIKRILNSLDISEGDLAEGGADFVISKFSLEQVLKNPTALLDALILYLFLVHSIDWYSSTWGRTSTMSDGKLGKREESDFVGVDHNHDNQVTIFIADLRLRTEQFLEKVQKWIRRDC